MNKVERDVTTAMKNEVRKNEKGRMKG